MCGVELLVSPHQRYQIFRVAQIYYVMGVTGKHMHRFDFITRNLEFDNFVRADFAFLNESATRNNDKKLPFTVMPMLTFGYTGL